MWPFRRKKAIKVKTALRRIVAGMIIGGAIGSIIGKKLMKECECARKDEDEDEKNGR